MRNVLTAVLALSLALAALAARVASGAAAEAVSYRVIVHPSNSVTAVRRSFLADAYLKKVTRWPDERVIRPADLSARSLTRVKFSADVLRRSIDAVQAYWQRRIFAGQAVPPPEFAQDAEVVAYVLQHPTAIGYISAETDAPGVRSVTVTP